MSDVEEGESRAAARRKKRKARAEGGAPRSAKRGVERAREGAAQVASAPVLARPAVRFTYACKTSSREVGRTSAGVTMEHTYAKHDLEAALPKSGSADEARPCASCRGALGIRYYALDATWRPRAALALWGAFFAAAAATVLLVGRPSDDARPKFVFSYWGGVLFLGVVAGYCFLRAAKGGSHWTVKKAFFNKHELVAGEVELLE